VILLGNGSGILAAQDAAEALLHCLESEPVASGCESIVVFAVLFVSSGFHAPPRTRSISAGLTR
jgi:hypothetical protein